MATPGDATDLMEAGSRQEPLSLYLLNPCGTMRKEILEYARQDNVTDVFGRRLEEWNVGRLMYAAERCGCFYIGPRVTWRAFSSHLDDMLLSKGEKKGIINLWRLF